jgi:hypothetical protein
MPAAADIVVRRCTVQVVRHGGWSWGPQPRRLVDQVLAALPCLIAERLAHLVPDDASGNVEITEPVRIAVSLSLADLRSGRFGARDHVAAAAELLQEPAPASDPALPRVLTSSQQVQVPGDPHQVSFVPHTLHQDARTAPRTLAEFICMLYERGELGQVLALLPARTLESWYQSLAGVLAGRPGPLPDARASEAWAGDRPADTNRHSATHVTGRPTGEAEGTGRAGQLRDAISTIAARMSQGSTSGSRAARDVAPGFSDHPALATASSVALPPGTPATPSAPQPQDAADEAPPLASADANSAGRATITDPLARTPGAVAPAHIAPARLALTPAATTDADVACALPFLLLGPLDHAGYLAALGPALEPVGLQAQTAVFATALAYTVLGPLERGWRRRPQDVVAAAAFAGLGAPVPGEALTEFARVTGLVLPVLDAVVTRALADGHTAGEPLVLVTVGERADDGLLLFDREGLFPVAWADDAPGLLPAWRIFGSPPILAAPAAVGALRRLADDGASFAVATPPARAERWRRLPPHQLWTNTDDPALTRHAGGYQQAVDLATELARALVAERAAAPLADGPALGRSLLLAAGLGLGTLAWTLWREREPADPLLALERFADLSARVSFEQDRVRVRLPLGSRHSDLSAHGLLADVPGVPWFGGRVVEFSGG